jgi:hypothetical protein
LSSLVKINNQNLEVKEFNGQRVVTFKDIDTLHERVEGTAGRNFRENKERFIENVDFFFIKPADIQNNEIRRSEINNSGTYLITESGYLMLVKSFTDDLAWKVQRQLVNTYFRAKEQNLLINQLSPNLQLFNQLFQALANNELEQKKLQQAVTETKQEIQAIRDVVALNPNAWRKETTEMINKMAQKIGGFEHIQLIREESYKMLDEKLGVSLAARLLNKKKKMALEGVCKSKIDKVNKLDVIADDKKLINGYVNIIKELAIKYGVA